MIRPWPDVADLDRRWGDGPVLGNQLRQRYPQRWTRYYTLPGGERIARTDEQRAEQMRRYLAVLAALGTPALITTCTWGERSEVDVPAAHWRDLPGDPAVTVSVSAVDHLDDLVPLLRLVADDLAHEVILAPADLSWFVHPYDGGLDVIHGDVSFPDWQSPRLDGL